MWSITESNQVHKIIPKLPPLIRDKYELWKAIVINEGPDALRERPGFRDEALSGEWAGFRSSRLSIQWRVIYRIYRQQFVVHVERITPHDYRR